MSQDAQYSQFYASPVHLNPALTGSNGAMRGVLNYRNQWTGIPGSFVVNSFAFDLYKEEYKSGIGIYANRDQAGSARIATTDFGLLYSYGIPVSRDFTLKAGLQVGYAIRTTNYNDMIFGDQLDPNQGFIGGVTAEPGTGDSYGYFDFSSGAVLFNEQLWIGAAAHHMNEPSLAFSGISEAQLPTRISVHGGVYLPIKKAVVASDQSIILIPHFQFKKQGSFYQLDLGALVDYAPFAFGLGYRGFPLKSHVAGITNQDALIATVAFSKNNFRVGYSFDFTLSTLGLSTGGSHEISLIYSIHKKSASENKNAFRNVVPLPYKL